MYRHSVAQRGPRENSHFTGFLRLPTQFAALKGPVLDFFGSRESDDPLRIVSVGCSNGAEAVTAASVLWNHDPGLSFMVLGCDLEPHVVERARTGVYDEQADVFFNKRLTSEFVAQTFDISGASYRVKSAIRDRLRFEVADVLDSAALEKLGPADIIFAQNFLFHLEPRLSERAFENICAIARQRSALFLDGTDIPLRNKLTRRFGFRPLDYQIESIHEEARLTRAAGWPYHYWGLEPFMTTRRDWCRRYSTIFLRE